jgi:hypothetical protein
MLVIGITLLSADDFETWFFSIEVLGESLYQVRALISEFLDSYRFLLGRGIQVDVSL